MADLRELFDSTTCVLFDFDGPVCRLFAGYPADGVAADLVSWLRRQGREGLLTGDEARSGDPHAVLRAVALAAPDSGFLAELEAELTEHELRATDTAEPTQYADELILALRSAGRGLAITTNNSAPVVARYLTARGLIDCFGHHIHGRTRDLHRLKPDPDCLLRALDSTGVAAGRALMIGDTPADCVAARKAGVPFVGYARNQRKRNLLLGAGATTVVPSMKSVLMVVGSDLEAQ
ncbi:hydrolase [Streptomyces camponoticapitis]|uniref:Hydrolase n=1 Tax=Streptomyces camponoticapitis TaxID=1616125 RepID=A0ABQ2ENZ4_9ACTN|nr:HAD-IA family hydrolase [Streptomyces camponoticapitis]GGK18801.1 hydrolase [Streptomyces camponoticapitis]